MRIFKKIRTPKLSYHTITILLAAYFALALNLPIYKQLTNIFNKLETVDTGFVISIPFFFFFALTIIFSLFTWPKITKAFFVILLIISSIVCYASFNYGILFDINMIQNIIQTNTSEATSYISTVSILWVAILGIFPAILLMMSTLKTEKIILFLVKKASLILISVAGILIIASFYYQDYASVGRNNNYLRKVIIPTFYIHSLNKYVHQTYFSKPIPYTPIGLDARQKKIKHKKPSLLVFILGETARSQNYHFDGYSKSTTPYTSKLDMISFKNVSSCGTATAISVPCMFSRLNRRDYDEQKAYHQDNLLDVLKRADIDVLWRENDSADEGIPKNVHYQNLKRSDKYPLCNNNRCLDMALLKNFDKDVEKLSGNRLVVLHLMGSHGPTYYQRYPKDFAYFQPDCPRSDIENCTREQLINSYDNTIRYTDYMVAQTIKHLKQVSDKYSTALIYMSDHGESLGESGIYLHGMPYMLAPDYQKRIPLMVWLSEDFKKAKDIDDNCLKDLAQTKEFSHDNFFDSVLGILDVSTDIYRKKSDLFAACRTINAVTLAKN